MRVKAWASDKRWISSMDSAPSSWLKTAKVLFLTSRVAANGKMASCRTTGAISKVRLCRSCNKACSSFTIKVAMRKNMQSLSEPAAGFQRGQPNEEPRSDRQEQHAWKQHGPNIPGLKQSLHGRHEVARRNYV